MAQTIEKKSMGQVRRQERKSGKIRMYDYSMLFVILFLCGFGLLMVFSSTSYTNQIQGKSIYASVIKQGLITLVGLVGMVILSKLDYHKLLVLAPFAAMVSFVLCIMVLVIGTDANGSSRWLKVGPLSFQPSEMVKISLIMLLACFLNRHYRQIAENREFIGLRGVLLTIFLVSPVIVENLSTGVIILGIGFLTCMIVSKDVKPYLIFIGAGVAFALALYWGVFDNIGFLKVYQMKRIMAWRNLEAYSDSLGYQTLQSLYAIGSGGLFGKGLGQSTQKLGALPEAQNDMIFSIVCEELGFLGGLFLIILYILLLYRILYIAINAPDFLGFALSIGVMCHLFLQVTFNIGVATNLLPNTGVSLPFVSTGGTAILFVLIEMGLVLSVSNRIFIEKISQE